MGPRRRSAGGSAHQPPIATGLQPPKQAVSDGSSGATPTKPHARQWPLLHAEVGRLESAVAAHGGGNPLAKPLLAALKVARSNVNVHVSVQIGMLEKYLACSQEASLRQRGAPRNVQGILQHRCRMTLRKSRTPDTDCGQSGFVRCPGSVRLSQTVKTRRAEGWRERGEGLGGILVALDVGNAVRAAQTKSPNCLVTFCCLPCGS